MGRSSFELSTSKSSFPCTHSQEVRLTRWEGGKSIGVTPSKQTRSRARPISNVLTDFLLSQRFDAPFRGIRYLIGNVSASARTALAGKLTPDNSLGTAFWLGPGVSFRRHS